MSNNGEYASKYIKRDVYKTCPICFGLSVLERENGAVVDCPNRKCMSGYIKEEILVETENQDSLFN
jgi:hypothetical protein